MDHRRAGDDAMKDVIVADCVVGMTRNRCRRAASCSRPPVKFVATGRHRSAPPHTSRPQRVTTGTLGAAWRQLRIGDMPRRAARRCNRRHVDRAPRRGATRWPDAASPRHPAGRLDSERTERDAARRTDPPRRSMPREILPLSCRCHTQTAMSRRTPQGSCPPMQASRCVNSIVCSTATPGAVEP